MQDPSVLTGGRRRYLTVLTNHESVVGYWSGLSLVDLYFLYQICLARRSKGDVSVSEDGETGLTETWRVTTPPVRLMLLLLALINSSKD